MQMAQVAVCSQTNTKHINTIWAEHTVVKVLNLLVYPVTSRHISRNVLNIMHSFKTGNQLPINTESHPRRMETSTALL
jgi:hypothetical protein